MKVHEKAAAAHHRRPDHHPCTPYPAPEPPIPFPSPANAHNQTWLNKTCRIGAMRSSHIAEQLVVGHQVYTLEGLYRMYGDGVLAEKAEKLGLTKVRACHALHWGLHYVLFCQPLA